MDRSFGASTSVLHTPSPLDRRSGSTTLLSHAQLAQSISPSALSTAGTTTTVQPLSFNPGTVPIRSTTSTLTPSSLKTVRFSPAAAHSSAPASRIQGFATPPRSYSSPSLLRTAAANSSAAYGLGSGAVATPPPQTGQADQQQHQGQQVQHQQSPHSASKLHLPHLPVQAALAKSSSAVHAVQDQLHHAGNVVHSAKHKLDAVPLGRGETARRLRVNAVLLVAWWVSSRTTVYRFAAGHLVAAAPQLDTPLHVCETLLLLLLCYNIIDSLRTLNQLSSLPSASTTVAPIPGASPSRPTALRAASSSSSFGTPVRSSPKTRASPSPFKAGAAGSPSTATATTPGGSRLRGTPQSPFRASALASPSPPTPQTPTSALRSAGGGGKGADGETAAAAAAALRRSLSRSAGAQGAGAGSPSEGASDEVSVALLAYEARHAGDVSLGGGGGGVDSPRSIKVESREDVERLFGSSEQQ
ncbi:hypothetical protein JCM3775_005972 [Rhodotorula graminis]